MTTQEEKNIIQKVIAGDKNAYEELVLANQKNVYNLAMKMTKNEEDALDISQEAFLKAYRRLEGFRGESKFSVWLYRLTYNLCIDFLRKNSAAKTISLDYEDTSGDIKPLEIPDLRNLPEDNAIRSETRKNIAESINELPLNHREILVMREVTGMSYDDISASLGINTGTVKSRLARAREKLVEILGKKGTFPEGYRLKLHTAREDAGKG